MVKFVSRAASVVNDQPDDAGLGAVWVRLGPPAPYLRHQQSRGDLGGSPEDGVPAKVSEPIRRDGG